MLVLVGSLLLTLAASFYQGLGTISRPKTGDNSILMKSPGSSIGQQWNLDKVNLRSHTIMMRGSADEEMTFLS